MGLTQDALAELAGVTTRTYQNAEAGLSISIHSARSITDVLGCGLHAVRRPSADEIRDRLLSTGYGPLPSPAPWGERATETSSIVEALTSEESSSSVCCLTGPTGIGKTALAQRLAEILADEFADGIVWVSAARNRTPQAASESMTRVARELGFGLRLPPRDLVEPEAFRLAFKLLFWSRRRLLILDDAESAVQVGWFAGDVVRGRSLATTMSRSVAEQAGGSVIYLGPLRSDSARQLLISHIGTPRVEEDQLGTKELLDWLGGNPRGIQVAGRALERERYTQVGDYLERFALTRIPTAQADTLDASGLETSLEVTYSQLKDRLPEPVWQTFAALSVFGDSAFGLDWAAAVTALPTTEARRHLSELTDVYLLREALSGSVGESDPATSRRGPLFTIDAQAQRLANRWASSHPVERLWRHASNVAEDISARPPSVAREIFLRDWTTWNLCIERAVERVQSGPDVEGPRWGDAAKFLSQVLLRLEPALFLDVPVEAGRWFEAGRGAALELGDRKTAARLTLARGRWYALCCGDYPSAAKLLGASLDLLSHLDDPEQTFKASHYLISSSHAFLGPRESLPLYNEHLALVRRLPPSPARTASALHIKGCLLATAAEDEAEWNDAKMLFEEALRDWSRCDDARVEQVSATVVSLAVTRHLDGDEREVAGLEHALSCIEALVADDSLESWRQGRVRELLTSRTGEASAPELNDETRRRMLLGVAPTARHRRMTKLMEMLAYVSGMWGRPPFQEKGERSGFVPGQAGIAELVLETDTEYELGQMLPILSPVSLARQLIAGMGSRVAVSFVELIYGPEHPIVESMREHTTRLTLRG